jgi:parallel beta-helix repeat protein
VKSVVFVTMLLLLGSSIPANAIQSIHMEITAFPSNSPLINGNNIPNGGVIDVYTQYQSPYGGQGQNNPSDMFWPAEEVKLCANVTYNGLPVQQKQVDFEMKYPDGQLWWETSNVTDDSGQTLVKRQMPWPVANPESVFGVWHVTALANMNSTVINDTTCFHYDYQCRMFRATVIPPPSGGNLNFAHGELVTVTVVYGSHSQRPLSALFSVTLFDELSTPINLVLAPRFIGGALFPQYSNNSVQLSVQIPTFAVAGYATFHINAYDKDPMVGGFPYCPEYAPAPTIFVTPYSTKILIVPDNYSTIQQTINHAHSGEVIYIRKGRYEENVIVNKTLTLIGDNPASTVVDGQRSGNVITVRADDVVIKSLNIANSGSGNAGVFVESRNRMRLEANTISNNSYGIWLASSQNNLICQNNFDNNTHQVHTINSMSTWDNGYPSGGNYWSDYDGMDLFCGPFQNVSGSDEIGDFRYIVDGTNLDRYPFMKPFVPIDIEVNDITSASDFVGHGYALDLTVTITSRGYEDKDVNLAVYARGDTIIGEATYLVMQQLVVLPGNCSSIIALSWDTTLFALGNYTLQVLVLPISGEIDMCDNGLTGDTISIELVHDVAVTNIKAKTVVFQGYCANLTVTVENQGNFDETFNLTTYHDDKPMSYASGKNYTTIAVQQGKSVTVTVVWKATDVARSNYTVKALLSIVQGEKDTVDNFYSDGWIIVTLAGDITGTKGIPDGKCDIRDISFAARWFGQCTPPAPTSCDINNDAKIDLKDIVVVARHFGEEA